MKLEVKDIILIIFTFLFLVGLGAVGFVIYKKKHYKKDNLPDDNIVKGGDVTNKLTESQKQNAKDLADEIYDEMKGWHVKRSSEPHKEFLQCSDTMFVAVANVFGKRDDKTLWNWYEDEKPMEWLKHQLFNVIRDNFEEVRDAILKRFSRLYEQGVRFGEDN